MSEYNTDNMVELADYIVRNSDMDFLQDLAYTYLIESYEVSEETFSYDWEAMFGPPYEDENGEAVDDIQKQLDNPDIKIFKGD